MEATGVVLVANEATGGKVCMRVLNFDEAAQRGSFTRRTLERLIANGEGPSVVHISARRRGILETDWENWLLSRRRVAPGANEFVEKGAA